MAFRFKRLSLYFSVHLLLLITAIFIGLILFSLRSEIKYATQHQQESFAQLLNVTELLTANALWQYNNIDIAASGDSLFQIPEVVMVQIIDNRNIERYYQVKSGPSTESEYLHRYDRLLYKNDVPVGEVIIVFTDYYAYQQVYANTLNRFWQLGIVFTILGVAIWRITRPIVRDILYLTESAHEMAAGDLKRKIKLEANDELGTLAASLSRMSDNLRAQLEESKNNEARFRSLVANIPGIVYRCSPDEEWTMDFISPNVEEITGYPPQDFLGERVRSFASIIHPDDRDAVKSSVSQDILHKRSYNIEYRIICRDASVRWMQEKGQEIYDDKNRLLWLDGIIFDITESKQIETRLQQYTTHLETSNSLAGLILSSSDFTTISQEILKKLQAAISCSEVALFAFSLDQQQVRLLAALGPVPEIWQEQPCQPAANYPWLKQLQNGSALSIHEKTVLELATDASPDHIEYPLLMGAKLVGSLHLAALPQTAFSSKDCEMVKTLSTLLALALQRHELEEQRQTFETALRNSERKYRTLFEGANDAFLIIENGRFIEFNEKTLELFGRRREEMFMAQAQDFSPQFQMDGRTSSEAEKTYINLALSGEPQSFLWTHLHASGTPFTVEVNLNRIFLPPHTFIVAALRDVTERLQTQERLQQANITLEKRLTDTLRKLDEAKRGLEQRHSS